MAHLYEHNALFFSMCSVANILKSVAASEAHVPPATSGAHVPSKAWEKQSSSQQGDSFAVCDKLESLQYRQAGKYLHTVKLVQNMGRAISYKSSLCVCRLRSAVRRLFRYTFPNSFIFSTKALTLVRKADMQREKILVNCSGGSTNISMEALVFLPSSCT